jgi:hypothetical protein
MQGRFKNETRRHMTTVEADEVSFNSFESHTTNRRRRRLAIFPWQVKHLSLWLHTALD